MNKSIKKKLDRESAKQIISDNLIIILYRPEGISFEDKDEGIDLSTTLYDICNKTDRISNAILDLICYDE